MRIVKGDEVLWTKEAPKHAPVVEGLEAALRDDELTLHLARGS